MYRYLIPCECGNGSKDFFQASEFAQNPGRFYYRCPVKTRTCSFIWADELLSHKYAHIHHLIVPCTTARTQYQHSPCGPRPRSAQQFSSMPPSDEASSIDQSVRTVKSKFADTSTADQINICCCCYAVWCTIVLMIVGISFIIHVLK